jgi:DeoR/GlpR family transcriptional regulator of sugar metabolism
MDVSAVHETITDRGIPKQDLRALREAEVEVTLV